MNQKLKQQLKMAYEAPPPKRKQEFLQQIGKQTLSERIFLGWNILYSHKWVWVTSLGILLIVMGINIKLPTIENDFESVGCSSHIWICTDERCISPTQTCFKLECRNCSEVKTTIETIIYSDEEVYFSDQRREE